MRRAIDPILHLARRPDIRGPSVAFFVYTLITLVMLYPIPFRLNSVIAGFAARDGWQYTWWLWFARRLLLEGRGFGDLYLMNYPAGLQHPYQWSLVYINLIALPLGTLFSPATSFNLMVLASFILSGLSAYHLCRELTRNHWAALVGGAIFAFAPNRLGHAMAGWLPQMTVYFYPWYALLLTRTLRRPTLRRSISLGVLAGIAATVYAMHIAYIMVPLTLGIVGAELVQRRRAFLQDRRGRYLGLSFAISLVIAVPFLLPLIIGRFQGGLGYLSTHGVVEHSTDLLAFFTPSPYHPILAPLGIVPSFAARVFADPGMMRARLAYPGLVAVLLAAWGVLKTNPRPWRWVVLAVCAAVLALGPILIVGGEPVEYTADGYRGQMLLPFALLQQVPFLDWGRTPGRINVVGMLGLGILAAYGAADILSRLGTFRWRTRLFSLASIALLVFEFLPIWPFPSGDARIPPVIQHIAGQPGDGTLLHLPLKRRAVNHRALYFQTVLDRPIVGGEVLRMLPETLPWWESIEGLVISDPASDAVPRPTVDQRRAWLRRFDVDWVVLHRLFPEDEGRYWPFIEELLGPTAAEDESLVAFAVPADVSSPQDSLLYTFSRTGWYEPEQGGGLWRRWLREDGQLYIYSTREEVGSLRFAVDSHLAFPVLEVYLNEELVDTFVVGEHTTYTTRPFTLAQGMNVFRFHAPGGCTDVLDDSRCWSDALLNPPAGDGTPPCDMPVTCRTFVLDSVSFVPQGDLPAGAALDVNFGDQMRLRGWALEETTVHPGDMLTLTLVWESMIELSEQHVVFVHLLSSDGSMVAQHDASPVGLFAPSSIWPVGATFGYPVTLELPDDLPPGDYRLVTGVYLWPEVERLTVLSDVPGAKDNLIELGQVRIAP